MTHRFRSSMRFRTGVVGVLVLLAFCGPGAPGWPVAAEKDEVRIFVVDPAASEITVLLFKEGLFSGFAHDHVLVTTDLSGRVALHGNGIGDSTLQLSVPVASFRVDLPEHRAREKLTSEIDAQDLEEIRETMLGPEQLDAARHPTISATVERIEGQWPSLTVYARLRIRGGEQLVPVPAKVELVGNTLSAKGEFELLQSDFDIEPFSAYLGAVSVQDRIRVRYRIVAAERP